ncbi:PhzF family phenazine biosynthesis protein [Bacillus sp. Sa1BUA2]|uniref:PhzF family phenazine biosynthesis protein n=1 Tax=Bacillus norwichensis TaxID=2762217 RepID=A0ABR8VQP8_9BACI|nr:PhzF family phenazine biosynthesis protein [Bacillus norwichensis]
MEPKFYIVDVFAENKYEGNQLAVCLPDENIEQEEMQAIAKEINFSETTFIMSGLKENGGYDVKIFTPDSEIPFAGHPTIGTAFIIQQLFEDHKAAEIKLNLKVGQVPVVLEDQYAWMTQNQPVFGTEFDSETIAKALQIDIEDINNDYPIQVVSTGLPSIIVNLKTLDAVNKCKVNHQVYDEMLEKVGDANLLVFTDETMHSENDLHTRVFMFTSGHLEDPATGSANGNLAGYLLKHNFFNKNNISYSVEQGYSIGRPSLLKVKAKKKDDNFVIQVGGSIFIVAEGKWL